MKKLFIFFALCAFSIPTMANAAAVQDSYQQHEYVVVDDWGGGGGGGTTVITGPVTFQCISSLATAAACKTYTGCSTTCLKNASTGCYYCPQVACPTNCETCSSSTSCTTCKAGYYKSGSNCVKTDVVLPDGTLVSHPGVDPKAYCTSRGLKWMSTRDYGTMAVAHCADANCTTGRSSDAPYSFTCSACSSGLTLSNNRCSEASACSVANCATCNGSSCTKCQAGYVLYNNKCEPCPKGALACDGSASWKCPTGYADGNIYNGCMECKFKSLSACNTARSSSADNLDKCTGCQLKTGGATGASCYECSNCTSGYAAGGWWGTGGYRPACHACLLTNCDVCADSSSYSCTKCKAGYYFKGSGSKTTNSCAPCPANGTCDGSSVICNTGYYRTGTATDGYTCTKCSLSNCSVCSSATTCSTCASGFTLVNGKCESKNTVSGSCPSYMRKSSDGNCCVFN